MLKLGEPPKDMKESSKKGPNKIEIADDGLPKYVRPYNVNPIFYSSQP
jgi:hypothetical protein